MARRWPWPRGPAGTQSEARLFRVGADGSQFREVFGPFRTRGANDRLAWTRDGRAILFTMTDPTHSSEEKIMRISADGGQPEFTGLEIKRPANDFAVSQDGKRVAFATRSLAGAEDQLWAVDLSRVWNGQR